MTFPDPSDRLPDSEECPNTRDATLRHRDPDAGPIDREAVDSVDPQILRETARTLEIHNANPDDAHPSGLSAVDRIGTDDTEEVRNALTVLSDAVTAYGAGTPHSPDHPAVVSAAVTAARQVLDGQREPGSLGFLPTVDAVDGGESE